MDASLLYNLLIAGGALTPFAASRLLSHKISGTRKITPGAPKKQNPIAEDIAHRLKRPLQNYLRSQHVDVLDERGFALDIERVIESEIQRRSGRYIRDVYIEEESEPSDRKFMLAYTRAFEKGLDDVQNRVELLLAGTALALEALEQEYTIYAIGTDICKIQNTYEGFHPGVIKNVPQSSSVNLFHGLDTLIGDAQETDGKTTLLCFANERSAIIDHGYTPAHSQKRTDHLLVYGLGGIDQRTASTLKTRYIRAKIGRSNSEDTGAISAELARTLRRVR